MKRIGSTTGTVMRGPTKADADFALASQAVETLISSSGSSQTTVDDVVYDVETSATIDHEHQLTATPLTQSVFDNGLTYESLDPSIATVSQAGKVTRVSDGTARILATAKVGICNIRRRIDVAVSRQTGATSQQFNSYASGSFARYASDAIDTRISGKTPSAAKPIYSTQNHAAATYVRNTGCWAADLDLTCCSPWNSSGANTRAGTLISPRHIAFAEHYQIGVGATVRFVAGDNTVVDRTMTARQSLSGGSGYETDITIGLLDSDVPESISFARVLPANWATYLPSLSHALRVPCLVLDQEEKALVADLTSLGSMASFAQPNDATRLSFYESIISGDSGNPAFLIDSSGLILVTTWTFGGAGSGPDYSDWLTGLNAILTSLGGGYQLTAADLSGFNTY